MHTLSTSCLALRGMSCHVLRKQTGIKKCLVARRTPLFLTLVFIQMLNDLIMQMKTLATNIISLQSAYQHFQEMQKTINISTCNTIKKTKIISCWTAGNYQRLPFQNPSRYRQNRMIHCFMRNTLTLCSFTCSKRWSFPVNFLPQRGQESITSGGWRFICLPKLSALANCFPHNLHWLMQQLLVFKCLLRTSAERNSILHTGHVYCCSLPPGVRPMIYTSIPWACFIW